MPDPIIEEIWKFREEHEARFNYDADAIFEDMKRTENLHREQGRVYVMLPPNRVKPREPRELTRR